MKPHDPFKGLGIPGTEFTHKKKGEILSFLWMSLAVFLFLCLWSYTPEDIRFEASSPNRPARNFAAGFGAYLAWGLIFLFGKASYFFVVLLIFWALAAWSGGRRQSTPLRFFSGNVFFISSCALLANLSGPHLKARFEQGGIIGFFLAHFFEELFGHAGLYLILAIFFLSVLLVTEFLVLSLLASQVQWIGRGVQKLMAQRPLRGRLLRSAKKFPARASIDKNRSQIEASRASLEEMVPPPREKTEPPFEVKTLKTEAPRRPSRPKEAPSVEPSQKSLETSEGPYRLPPLDFLKDPSTASAQKREEIENASRVLEDTLADFGIDARVVEIEQGPVITRFELQPASGVKVQRITSLEDNIALALKATSVRILAPIPGKSRVGIEIPNPSKSLVTLKEVLLTQAFRDLKSRLGVAIGKDTAGGPILANLEVLPHLLIAGSTGSGKTVCVNAMISSILYNASPEEVKFILIDPKMVELTLYNDLPHLLTPVVTELHKVPSALAWLVSEMERRYQTLKNTGVRNMQMYNEKVISQKEGNRMPYIVVVIDELADLMMVVGKDVENAILRLAQLSRAVGIHLVLATQRPSVDVITGVIKANFPARISFQVASKVDSRTVLDMSGADALLGRGDLLFLDPGQPQPIRGQGAYISDEEIEKTVQFIKDQRRPDFIETLLNAQEKGVIDSHDFRKDEYYGEACRLVVSSGQASVSMIQRRLGLGYARAARLLDMMEEDGIVGAFRGSKPREVLIDMETLLSRQRLSQEKDKRSENSPS